MTDIARDSLAGNCIGASAAGGIAGCEPKTQCRAKQLLHKRSTWNVRQLRPTTLCCSPLATIDLCDCGSKEALLVNISKKVLINVEATPSCPAACSMCPRESIKEYGFISLEMMDRIVSQIDPSYVWELDLAGRGEPTIHPEF